MFELHLWSDKIQLRSGEIKTGHSLGLSTPRLTPEETDIVKAAMSSAIVKAHEELNMPLPNSSAHSSNDREFTRFLFGRCAYSDSEKHKRLVKKADELLHKNEIFLALVRRKKPRSII